MSMRILAGRSIAIRLAASAVFWSLAILLAAGVILSTLYEHSAEGAFDQRLLVYANDLAADLVTPGDPSQRELGSLGDPRFDIPLSGWYWQVGRPDARLRDMRASKSLLGNPLPVLARPDPNQRFGQIRKGYAAGPEERSLRIVERDIDLGEDGRFIVRVAGPADEITTGVRNFVGALTLTFLALGAALVGSTLLQIRFGLKPLAELGAAVTAIRRGEAERIPGNYPKDIAPLAQELNLLLERNREILERARTQVGNLAHALKTPLSIIVNEADAPSDDLSRRVREQATLMRDQVGFYLDRARAAALAGALGAVTEVAPVIEAVARISAKIHRDKVLDIATEVAPGIRFRGERQDFEEMVGNLVDNACKWAAGRVTVSATTRIADGRTRLIVAVEDDGPGLPEAARAEMLKRGQRLDETKPGSGLGLSIVVDLAGLHQGSLALGESPLGGLRAVLDLPAEDA